MQDSIDKTLAAIHNFIIGIIFDIAQYVEDLLAAFQSLKKAQIAPLLVTVK